MGAILPLVLGLAPELARWLFGGEAEKTTQAVTDVVKTVTGTTDEVQQIATLESNPEVAANLRIELAKIAAQKAQEQHATEQAQLTAVLADKANARDQTIDLAKASSSIAYGAPIISFVVVVVFAIVMALTIFRIIPPDNAKVLDVLLGTLAGAFTAVVQYWVGSSAGSAQKTHMLYASTPPPPPPPPTQVKDQ